MTSAITIFARYNRHANRLLYELLEKQDEELLSRDSGAYFTSIIGILNHILTSYLGWLVRFRDGGIESAALESPALEFTHPGFGRILHPGLTDLRDHQEQTDEVVVNLVAELEGATGPGPDEVFSYTNTRGERHRFRIGELLLHVLNHATHHRGHISQILDAAGVDHDFSNLFPILEEPEA